MASKSAKVSPLPYLRVLTLYQVAETLLDFFFFGALPSSSCSATAILAFKSFFLCSGVGTHSLYQNPLPVPIYETLILIPVLIHRRTFSSAKFSETGNMSQKRWILRLHCCFKRVVPQLSILPVPRPIQHIPKHRNWSVIFQHHPVIHPHNRLLPPPFFIQTTHIDYRGHLYPASLDLDCARRMVRSLPHGNWYRRVQRTKGVVPWGCSRIGDHNALRHGNQE
jgi:hypothetical protein